MSESKKPGNAAPNPTRRHFLSRAALAVAVTPVLPAALAENTHQHAHKNAHTTVHAPAKDNELEPFYGKHQSGITTAMQRHTYFMAFDLTTLRRADVIALLQAWTDAAAILTQGPAALDVALDKMPQDSGAMIGLSSARLTITFGFGPGLFQKDGIDRYGLASQRPAALANLPRFTGDQLISERSGGDLSVQACADDPQVAEYAIRRIASLLQGRAKIRWAQTGFNGNNKAGDTLRNPMGFKDGTVNMAAQNPDVTKLLLWAGAEGPAWMQDGSYMVIRTIRVAIEHWDQMTLGFQEATVGRHKHSGAPIGKQHEFEAHDFDANDAEGNPIVAENAHVRMAAAITNDGAQIFRRSFSYDNGVANIAERWPPWHQVMTFDAGQLFLCYQRDPRSGFSKIFENMAKFDMLNQFTTHVGSGLFACPPAARKGEYIGQQLFLA